MFKVVSGFKCSATKRIYVVGEEYKGDQAEEHIELGHIEEVADQERETPSDYPKHVGGGMYELSNGDKVKGKNAAIAAQAEIDASGK